MRQAPFFVRKHSGHVAHPIDDAPSTVMTEHASAVQDFGWSARSRPQRRTLRLITEHAKELSEAQRQWALLCKHMCQQGYSAGRE
jgi:hypothetical protein